MKRGRTMKIANIAVLISCASLLATPGAAQLISGGTCSSSSLNGTYSLALNGRAISPAGNLGGSFLGIGTATFDGVSAVTFTGTDDTNLASGTAFTYSGTYALPSNCYGTITLASGSTATFMLVAWDSGKQFNVAGTDATYTYSGHGDNALPACATPTLSGAYSYIASGSTLTGTAQTGAADESGIFQFDGQGNVTASYALTSGGTAAASVTSTGTYTVASSCLARATLTDSNGQVNNLNFVIEGSYGQALELIEANSQFVRAGSAHSSFLNPSQSIGNVASYAVNATPPGSVFVVFGTGLATKDASAQTTPLPTSLLSTTVTVNGEKAPLFFVNAGQIDAQMPWDVPGGTVASVVVTNGNATSNAAAVFVPATGTPGISVYSTNRAVVVNQDGSVNSSTKGAAVGDEEVVYFTGGGPVQASGPLVTGAPAPAGQSPVTGNNTLTVGGINATVKYMGLTPAAIGLYQANFLVPQIDKGTYQVVITIADQASNNPVMTVSN
jgi:uncharacterized protein (TIGR03437 family)